MKLGAVDRAIGQPEGLKGLGVAGQFDPTGWQGHDAVAVAHVDVEAGGQVLKDRIVAAGFGQGHLTGAELGVVRVAPYFAAEDDGQRLMAPAGAKHRQRPLGRFQKERLKRFGPGIALSGGKLAGATEQHRVDAVKQVGAKRITRDVHTAELVGAQAAAF